MSIKQKKVSIRLKPFPAHELEWLIEQRGENGQAIISEAVILYAARWRAWIEEKEEGYEEKMGKNLGG